MKKQLTDEQVIDRLSQEIAGLRTDIVDKAIARAMAKMSRLSRCNLAAIVNCIQYRLNNKMSIADYLK